MLLLDIDRYIFTYQCLINKYLYVGYIMHIPVSARFPQIPFSSQGVNMCNVHA